MADDVLAATVLWGNHWLAAAVALLAGLGAVYYARLWRSLPRGPLDSPFTIADAGIASGLSLWFIVLIVRSGGGPQIVSSEAIAASAIVYAVLVGLLFGMLAIRRISPVKAFGLWWRDWRSAMPLLGLSFLAILPVVAIVQWAASLLGGGKPESQPLLDFWVANPDFASRALVAGMAVIVAPAAEEAIFRGYLYGAARRFAGPTGSMLAASLLFAAVHIHLPAFLGLFALAMALNIIYEKTGSLWAPVIMHGAFNACSLAAAVLWPEAA